MKDDFATFLPMGTKEGKRAPASLAAQVIFKEYGRGVATSRDDWAYDFDASALAAKMQRMIEFYNHEMDHWRRRRKKFEGSKESAPSIDDFVDNDETKIKWSRDLKLDLQRDRYGEFAPDKIRRALYRPFCKKHVFFDRIFNEEVYILPSVFPTPASENENTVIWLKVGSEVPMFALMTNIIPDLMPQGGTQCFPFYVYDEGGLNRRENITDWALEQFQSAYGAHVTKRDIFYYVYAILHHPDYRARYAENLKRELPRIPLIGRGAVAAPVVPNTGGETPPLRGDFSKFVEIGARLAQLHLTYEQAPEYPLRWIENKDVSFSWRVTKMKLSPDKSAVVVNDSLTLAGLPPECFDYRLGNRSALEWVIDQYQVSTDKRSQITTDPNRADDPEYIIRLVGRVVTVSVETVKLVTTLAKV